MRNSILYLFFLIYCTGRLPQVPQPAAERGGQGVPVLPGLENAGSGRRMVKMSDAQLNAVFDSLNLENLPKWLTR